MTIFEIAKELPNGFHDSQIYAIRIDYPNRSIELILDIWIGTMDDPPSTREKYRKGTLAIMGLQYCAMDVPDKAYPFARADAVTIDLAQATEFIPQEASFGCRIWVNEWNGFIHIAAQAAEFVWTGPPVTRQGA